ncbi:hypothetical protein [Sphingomonas mali]|uniref:hypothetical protein n=1 Tax=Sphingomonas mali TaxID=40682 RepID=UPI0012ECC44B|nr:hypothetical protein [Sphingomonas mali]
MADEIAPRDLQRLAGIKPGGGFLNQADGCEMQDSISPDQAKEVLRRLARHITPGEWDAAVEERPEWEGLLSPART